jgi:hypothetical protein
MGYALMPHTFRTIEEFLIMLEERSRAAGRIAAAYGRSGETGREAVGREGAFQFVADIVRNSNLGIVYPPEDK